MVYRWTQHLSCVVNINFSLNTLLYTVYIYIYALGHVRYDKIHTMHSLGSNTERKILICTVSSFHFVTPRVCLLFPVVHHCWLVGFSPCQCHAIAISVPISKRCQWPHLMIYCSRHFGAFVMPQGILAMFPTTCARCCRSFLMFYVSVMICSFLLSSYYRPISQQMIHGIQ